MAYIYKITNELNGIFYIGATKKSLSERWNRHVYNSRTPGCTGHNAPLAQGIRKYGAENFTIETIEECPDEIRSEREKYWIQLLGATTNGYNTNVGGGAIPLDAEKMRKALTETQSATKTAEIMGCSLVTVHAFRIKEGIDIYDGNNPRQSGKISSGPILCVEPSGDRKIFNSTRSAAIYCIENGLTSGQYNTAANRIATACKGKRKTAYGCYWMRLADRNH